MIINFRLCLFVAVLTVLPLGNSFAATIESASEVARVTVFPDRAEVIRDLKVELPSGASEIVITGLPPGIMSDSLRASGLGNFAIASVELRARDGEDALSEREKAWKAQLQELLDKRRGFQDRIAAFQLQLEFIRALGRDGPSKASQQLEQGAFNPETWQKAWELLGSGADQAFTAIRNAEIEVRRLDREIEAKRNNLARVQTNATSTLTAVVQVDAKVAGPAQLELTYQLANAAWRPIYDARLNSETGRVQLVQLAEVRQRTGEDWTAVALTLSTSRPAQGAHLPTLDPWFVDFWQSPERRLKESKKKDALQKNELDALMMEQSESYASNAPALSDDNAAEPPMPAKFMTAEIASFEFSSHYRIAGKSTVLADSTPHKFVVVERELPVTLALRVAPKVAAQAYLTAELDYDGEDPLLPGPLAIFRDGTYVGTTNLALLRPGEQREISFGVDDQVQVEHRLVKGERQQEGIINRRQRLEQRFETVVTNHHKRVMAVTLLDRLPVPRDERIEVELLKVTTAVSEKDYDGRPGVLAWYAELEPGEARTFHFAYALSRPEDSAVPGF